MLQFFMYHRFFFYQPTYSPEPRNASHFDTIINFKVTREFSIFPAVRSRHYWVAIYWRQKSKCQKKIYFVVCICISYTSLSADRSSTPALSESYKIFVILQLFVV